MNNRITPERIEKLKPTEVFVFGSNQAGRHGAGAAKKAMEFGAIYGKESGHHGKTYAIPTLDITITHKVSMARLRFSIEDFIEYAIENPERTFLVTEIGCGLAGFKVEEVAPLFEDAVYVPNIFLPKRFWDFLGIKD